MIRRVLRIYRSELCQNITLFYKQGAHCSSIAETRDEKEALSTLRGSRFGSLGKTEYSPLNIERMSDDSDGYDTLEVNRTKRGPYFYVNTFTRLIHSKPVRLQEALRLFEEMQKVDRRRPDRVHFTLLISGCAKVGLTEKAFELFDMLLKDDLNPTAATVTALFNACAECDNHQLGIEKANFMRDWIFNNSYICNQKQFHAMIKAFAKHGDMKSAFEVLKEMIEMEHPITAETFSMLLMGCISNKVSGLLQAIKIVKQMISNNCRLDVCIYNLLLRAVRDCEIGSEPNLSQFLLKWTSETQVDCNRNSLSQLPFQVNYESDQLIAKDTDVVPKSPNLLLSTSISLAGQVVNFNFAALKKASNRLQLIGGTNGILEHMERNNVQPTTATFGLLLECTANTLQEENNLFALMQKYKVKPDTGFFNVIIKRRNMRQDFNSALSVLRQMQTLSVLPDIATFGVLAMGCHTKQLGLRLIKDMESAGFTLNIQTIGALISNACVRRDFDYILMLMNVISEKDIVVNAKVIECITTARIAARNLLLKQEKTNETIPRKYQTPEFTETFRRFNFKFKQWLRTVKFESDRKDQQQYDYEFSKSGYHGMYQLEKMMRKKIRERIQNEAKSL